MLFSIANQFYQIATEQGLDFYRIYEAITHKYPRIAAYLGRALPPDHVCSKTPCSSLLSATTTSFWVMPPC